MIPKKIHYCWYGQSRKPLKVRKCIESWRKFCPDYEIIEWNESNTEIIRLSYLQWCIQQKKYAFLSDYIRLYVIEAYGGLYFDTDVEILRSYDPLLAWSAFFGFETKTLVNTGIGFGAEAHHPIVRQMLQEYHPVMKKPYRFIGCPHMNTIALRKYGLTGNGAFQILDRAAIFPIDYFNPYDSATGQLHRTENTFSIHWYSASWLPPARRIGSKLMRPCRRLFTLKKD